MSVNKLKRVRVNELDLYYKLLEAWETSTPSTNRFLKCVSGIKWDYTFYADEEHYFVLGDFHLTTPTLDPFGEHGWPPSVTTSDRSIFWFDGTRASLRGEGREARRG